MSPCPTGSRRTEQLGAPQVLRSARQRDRAQSDDDAQHQACQPSELPRRHLDDARRSGEIAVEEAGGIGDLGRGHCPGQVLR